MIDYTFALNGSVQNLADLLPNPGTDNVACRTLHMQPDGANANAIFIGSRPTLTNALYGVRLPASASGVPPAPYIFEFGPPSPLRPSDFFVLGTGGEKLHVLIVPF